MGNLIENVDNCDLTIEQRFDLLVDHGFIFDPYGKTPYLTGKMQWADEVEVTAGPLVYTAEQVNSRKYVVSFIHKKMEAQCKNQYGCNGPQVRSVSPRNYFSVVVDNLEREKSDTFKYNSGTIIYTSDIEKSAYNKLVSLYSSGELNGTFPHKTIFTDEKRIKKHKEGCVSFLACIMSDYSFLDREGIMDGFDLMEYFGDTSDPRKSRDTFNALRLVYDKMNRLFDRRTIEFLYAVTEGF